MAEGGNGASTPLDWPSHDLRDHGRQIHHDAAALAASVRNAADGAQRFVHEQVELRPFSTLGVAAGVGYLLGGGLSSRLTLVVLGAATRVVAALVARELDARILQRGSDDDSQQELLRSLREPQKEKS